MSEKKIDPDAYEAVDRVCYLLRSWDNAKSPTSQASYLVDVWNALSDLESWLQPEDRYENLD